jgi:hypothetical protein
MHFIFSYLLFYLLLIEFHFIFFTSNVYLTPEFVSGNKDIVYHSSKLGKAFLLEKLSQVQKGRYIHTPLKLKDPFTGEAREVVKLTDRADLLGRDRKILILKESRITKKLGQFERSEVNFERARLVDSQSVKTITELSLSLTDPILRSKAVLPPLHQMKEVYPADGYRLRTKTVKNDDVLKDSKIIDNCVDSPKDEVKVVKGNQEEGVVKKAFNAAYLAMQKTGLFRR